MNTPMRLIVKGTDWHCNIQVTDVVLQNETMLFAYDSGKLVGLFDIGAIIAMWISEKKEGG